MQILALLEAKPSIDAATLAPHRQAEAAAVWALHRDGIVRSIHFRIDRIGAVLLMEAADLAVAEVALGGLPLVRTGLLGFDLVPLAPFTGYEALFAPTREADPA